MEEALKVFSTTTPLSSITRAISVLPIFLRYPTSVPFDSTHDRLVGLHHLCPRLAYFLS